jgi:starch synthase
LRQLGLPILGIPAGVDYSRANPATDPQLPSRYDAEDSSQKAACKGAVQKQLGLELDVEHPLLFITGPLLTRQGQVVAELLPKLLDYPLSIVVGIRDNDDAEVVERVRNLAEQWKQRLAVLPLKSDQPNTLALAAADVALLGETSSSLHTYDLFALRYGAVPIADLSGAYADQLLDCDAKLQTGNCFAFESWTPEAVLGAIARAASTWHKVGFERLRLRIMRQDLGWERPTRRTIQLYRQVLGIKV